MEFVLEKSKWRCGQDGPNKLGEGLTFLLNDKGYMCCLGQFSLQINPEAHLYEKCLPNSDMFVEPNDLIDEDTFSDLSVDLVKINDNIDTTVDEKIDSIRGILEKAGHTLTVKD